MEIKDGAYCVNEDRDSALKMFDDWINTLEITINIVLM